MKHNKTIRLALEASGGGAMGSFTWGVLTRLLEEDRFIFPVGSGTSAGAMNLRPLCMTFNKHGWTIEARQLAKDGLNHVWDNIMDGHQSGTTARIMGHLIDMNKTLFGESPFVQMMHDIGEKKMSPVIQETYYHALADYLRQSNHSPDELKNSKHMTLYINASDQFNREHIYTGNQLTRDKFLASSALPGLVKPVINGSLILADGALQSNPNMDVTEIHRDEVDAHVLITPNQPQGRIRPRRQKDIPRHELADTYDLVLHQTFDQAALRCRDFETGKTNKPTLIIYPEGAKPVSKKDKLSTDPIFIHDQRQQGYEQAEAVITKSLSAKKPIPNLSFNDIKEHALRHRTPAFV